MNGEPACCFLFASRGKSSGSVPLPEVDMDSRTLVSKTIRGENSSRTPLYGWVSANLTPQLTDAFGSVEAFEDHYGFDMAHLFGGPSSFDEEAFAAIRATGEELTPEVLLQIPLRPVDRTEDYADVVRQLDWHQKQRGKFCYVQAPGIFEHLNGPFGFENHLCYLALYPEELQEVYHRQAVWNRQFADCIIDLGVDMVHVSDDWGAQRGLLFSPDTWRRMIHPYHKVVADRVKERGCFLSLHSDGNINAVLPGIVDLGYDVVHPWQEAAGMDYGTYLRDYGDRLGILGGLCIQTTLGFGDSTRLESEIRRVFGLLKGKRWMFCTTHFVQEHCSIEELVFAYDLATELARG